MTTPMMKIRCFVLTVYTFCTTLVVMTNMLLIEYNDHETLTINLLQPCFSVLRYTQDIFEREGVGGAPQFNGIRTRQIAPDIS